MAEPDDQTHMMNERPEPPTASHPCMARYPLVGVILRNAYRIDGKIGEGGMGIVYRATQLALDRPVAVKTIRLEHHLPPTAVTRFFREAKLLSQLDHPNIVHIIDFGTEEVPTVSPIPLHFMVMELLRGDSLEDFVKARGSLPSELVLDLMEQVCAGVSAAHQGQVVHRDLKPANALVMQVTGSARPIVKILDFGLGKMLEEGSGVRPGLTSEGVMMGTLCYSAPEQLEGATVDARADIYSLGAILFFLLTGRAPYKDEGMRATLVKQLSRPPDDLHAPGLRPEDASEVEAVIRKAMSPRPAGRFETADELFAALSRVLRPGETFSDRGRPSQLTPRPHSPQNAEQSPTRRAVLVAGGALVLGTAGLAVWASRRNRRPSALAATASGVTADEVTLGMSGPFSGPTRELGRGMVVGLKTCFSQVNDAGGIHGRKLRLIDLDDAYEPARAAANMKTLLDDKRVFAFVGNVGTPTTEATLPIALANERVFFGAYTGAKLLRKDPPDRYVFNYRASYGEETAAIVRYLVEVRKVPPAGIAVFAQNDGYGEAGFEGVAKALRKHGRAADEILKIRYDRKTLDVQPAVDAVVAAKETVRAVVMVATYVPASRFIQHVRDAGLGVMVSNVSFVGSEALAEQLRQLGPRYAAGVVVTQVVPHFASNATGVLNYRKHLRTYFPSEPPSFVSLEGYITARILVQGLLNAGPNLTSETLVEGLERIEGLDLAIGTKITFGPSNHQGSHKVWGTILDEKGAFLDLDLE